MPQYHKFRYGQETYGDKPPRYAHLPTIRGRISHAVRFNEAKFGQAKFGVGTDLGIRAEDSPPLTLGEEARKQIGKHIIYRRRYGKQEQYKWFKPDNPQTEDQQAHREEYKNAYLSWRALPEAEKETWREKAKETTITGYNLFMKEEMLK